MGEIIMINRKFFFDRCRSKIFGGKLSLRQVHGLSYILDVWEQNHGNWDDRWLAYALGTTHLETGAAMQPIHERGGISYFESNYGPNGINPKRAKSMGNTQPGDGAKYHGRGFVQLTWKVNYKSMSLYLTKKHGVEIDLLLNPDLASQQEYAAEIMFHGMSTGIFTGKKFSDYFSKKPSGSIDKDNWRGARAIINGTDKAEIIANFGRDYYSCISYI